MHDKRETVMLQEKTSQIFVVIDYRKNLNLHVFNMSIAQFG